MKKQTQELRKKTSVEIERAVSEARAKLHDAKFKLSAGQIKDTAQFQQWRRQIARLLTIKKELA